MSKSTLIIGEQRENLYIWLSWRGLTCAFQTMISNKDRLPSLHGYLTSNFQAKVSWNATITQRQKAHCEFVNTFIFLNNLIDYQCGLLWSAYGDVWCEVFSISHWLTSNKVFRCNKLTMWLVASFPYSAKGNVCSILFFCNQTVIPL